MAAPNARNFRALLKPGAAVILPGVANALAARVVADLGFAAAYVTGAGIANTSLGIPDNGLVTITELARHVSAIRDVFLGPLMVDADTGFGNALNMQRTIRTLERAGADAIQIEDQEFPKKCGHTPDRRVVPIDDMVRKVRVASDSRSSSDFLIIARTDARTGSGLDEAIRRGVAYAEAGADIIFVESPETEEELAEIGRRIDKPLLANMVNGGRTPMLPADRLANLGYSIAIYPAVGFLSAGEALQRAYADLQKNGTSTSAVPMYSFSEFNKLIGFEDVWDFERRYAESD